MKNIINFVFNLIKGSRKVTLLLNRPAIVKDWENINSLLKIGGPSHLRQALIIADRTLDATLKGSVKGESSAERIKNARYKLDPELYSKLWSAHKMRNSLVHETGFEPQHFMLKGAIETIRKCIRELGVKV